MDPKTTDELAAANKRIAELEGQVAGVNDAERAILKLTSKGLTRDQAIATLKRQPEFTAKLAEVRAEKKKALEAAKAKK